MNSTTVAPPPFHVHTTKAFVHYDTISGLWENKWKVPCSMGIYPFMDGKLEDLQAIFTKLIELSGDDAQYLYDADAYAAPFLPVARDLVKKAAEFETAGDASNAIDHYLRAGAVLRISRFPIIRSKGSALAWKLNKETYLKGGRYLNPPVQEVSIPFSHGDTAQGDASADIDSYLRIPKGPAPSNGWPVLLFICGLDAYRTDNTARTQAHVDVGFAVVIFEIPGTGDCPASRSDPHSPDRLMSSIIDWVHYMFEPSWVQSMNRQEYPFALAEAIACKFGCGTDDAAAFLSSDPMSKYSLFKQDIIGKQSYKILVAMAGRNKDLILRANIGHMGNRGAEEIIVDWLIHAVKV